VVRTPEGAAGAGASWRGAGAASGAGCAGEDLQEVRDDRSVELESGVVPWRSGPVSRVQGQRLRVALVIGVVPTAVGQVDAADERDVAGGVVTMPDDDQLLVVGAEHRHPLVQEHLPAGLVDLPAEVRVAVPADGSRYPEPVRTPDQPADLDASAGEIGEEVADRRTGRQEALVRVAAPVREPDPITRLQPAELLVQTSEVGGPVDERSHQVARGPGIELRILESRIPAFLRAEEPVVGTAGVALRAGLLGTVIRRGVGTERVRCRHAPETRWASSPASSMPPPSS
jgi:hypothetical protein